MEPMAAVADGLVIPGRTLWIVLWYAILSLGFVGLLGAFFWGPGLRWRNLDELLRGLGTIVVSVGMLAVLYGAEPAVGQVLLLMAVGIFASAYALGDPRRRRGGKPLQLVNEDGEPSPPPFRVIQGRGFVGPRRA
jgi:hypothetical protein